ncbi:MAG: nuclear transport factor 2 family protein [Gemmatimonadaceae bacterium]
MEGAVRGASAPEIVALEEQLRSAQLSADVSVLDLLIADRLLFTGPDGQPGTRAQDIDAHEFGVVRFHAHEPEELHIRRVGALRAECLILASDDGLRTELNMDVDHAVKPRGGKLATRTDLDAHSLKRKAALRLAAS